VIDSKQNHSEIHPRGEGERPDLSLKISKAPHRDDNTILAIVFDGFLPPSRYWLELNPGMSDRD